MKTKKPKLKLVGQNGNAFMILGLAKRAAVKAKWTPEQWKKVSEEMTSGDYNHLLSVACAHFDVS